MAVLSRVILHGIVLLLAAGIASSAGTLPALTDTVGKAFSAALGSGFTGNGALADHIRQTLQQEYSSQRVEIAVATYPDGYPTSTYPELSQIRPGKLFGAVAKPYNTVVGGTFVTHVQGHTVMLFIRAQEEGNPGDIWLHSYLRAVEEVVVACIMEEGRVSIDASTVASCINTNAANALHKINPRGVLVVPSQSCGISLPWGHMFYETLPVGLKQGTVRMTIVVMPTYHPSSGQESFE